MSEENKPKENKPKENKPKENKPKKQKSHPEERKSQENKPEEKKRSLEEKNPQEKEKEQTSPHSPSVKEVLLNGLFAFKKFMSNTYGENRNSIPVTYLKYEPWFVTQIKSEKKEGYSSLQIACSPKSFKNSNKAERGHFKNTPFEHSASFLREIRQKLPENVKVGQKVSISSLSKGNKVKISSQSKGRGFSGAIKRWGFGGGPASHGSRFHRQPGSVGNCAWPGRVMPGKKMPGHHGSKKQSLRSVEIIDILKEENVIIVKGSIPGSRNTLVKIMKEGIS